jgi:hypothetical protein
MVPTRKERTMLANTKRLTAVAAAVLALSAAIPVTSAGAVPEICNAVSHSTGSEVAVLLEGHYRWPKSTTAHVSLTCHIVQNGVKVVSVSDELPGHIAALASDERIGTDPFSVCYSIYVTDRPLTPPFPIHAYSTTNC